MGQKLSADSDTPPLSPVNDPEEELKAMKEAMKNIWMSYEWHHEPDLSELTETCYPLRTRCRVLRVSNIGVFADEEGKTMTFEETDGDAAAGPKGGEHIVKLVCMSDTHQETQFWLEKGAIPDGDVFLFAGDMTGKGRVEEVGAFVEFIKALPHKHKIVVAGNHGLFFFCFTLDYAQTFTCMYEQILSWTRSTMRKDGQCTTRTVGKAVRMRFLPS